MSLLPKWSPSLPARKWLALYVERYASRMPADPMLFLQAEAIIDYWHHEGRLP